MITERLRNTLDLRTPWARVESRVPLLETLRFALDQLGPAPKRVLEVGAGSGELALLLQQHGHLVLALDESEEAVAQARSLGVDARLASWPYVDVEPQDAVLFTRSLHHIRPLECALQCAANLLLPDGRILIEDFAFHEAGPETVSWLRDLLQQLEVARSLECGAHAFGWKLLRAADPFAFWHCRADHIHSAETMRAALCEVANIEQESAGPYLYRYVVPLLVAPDDPLEHLIPLHECAAAAAGRISLIGRRFVASPRPPGENPVGGPGGRGELPVGGARGTTW